MREQLQEAKKKQLAYLKIIKELKNQYQTILDDQYKVRRSDDRPNTTREPETPFQMAEPSK